ncbi:gliding motility-associated C-terminal domain-containing protein [Taibaiella sp. KBW10]|uniref:T9SS type B sorting domain-containing protein n=1 Tax=Taibaiella sp. KBW10 TaxID=2153357 RepID=UPI001315A794|nr:gliding motility-associated C-terminal domain-containing protein [Taibaiella sp. KBW10]
MKLIFNILLSIVLCGLTQNSFAQTVIINPNTDGGFEMGNTFAANGWTLVNNAANAGNNWFLGTTTLSNAGSSFASTGSRLAYISQSNNGSSWSYNINEYSTTHFYKDVAFPAGQTIIKLKFRWNAKGEGNNNQAYDVLYVYVAPTTLTPVTNSPFGTSNATTAWTGTGASTLLGSFHSCTVAAGTTADITLPANLAGTNRRLIFTWKNGNTLGVQPPAAIDSIALTSDCPKSTININNLTANCSNQINLSTTVTNNVTGGTYQWYRNNALIPAATNASYTSNTLLNGDLVQCVYSTNNACGYKDTANIIINYNTSGHSTELLDLCARQLPYTWRGVTIPTNAVTNPNYTTINLPQSTGCDSVITLSLTVRSSPNKTESISTCRNLLATTSWRGHSLPANAVSNNRFDSVFVVNPGGCDSLIYLSLQVIDSAKTLSQTLRDCYRVVYKGNNYYGSTTKIDTLKNAAGCDSIYNVAHIIVDNFTLNVTADLANPNKGEQITLKTGASDPTYEVFSWSPKELFPNQNATTQKIPAPENQLIQVVGKNDFGCTDTATILIKGTDFSKDFYMPNAFTPNGDGKNDVFAPIFKMDRNYNVVSFEIFNRWGAIVFGSYNSGDKKGWNGLIKGEKAPADVYYYYIVVYFSDGNKVMKKGDVTIIY